MKYYCTLPGVALGCQLVLAVFIRYCYRHLVFCTFISFLPLFVPHHLNHVPLFVYVIVFGASSFFPFFAWLDYFLYVSREAVTQCL